MLTNLALTASVVFAGPSAASVRPEFPAGPVFLLGTPVAAATAFPGHGFAPSDTGHVRPDSASVVSFETKDKQLLKASYYAPKTKRGNQDRAPAVLLLHDAEQSRDNLEDLAEYLHKKGFAVLTVDLRGHGASETEETNFKTADAKTRETLWALCTRDVDAAADFLLEQPGVHATNLSIFGVGAAAALAVRRATDDKNVRSVVLINPTAMAFGYNVAKGVGELGGLPTLVVAAKDEKATAARIQQAAHEANDGLEFVETLDLRSDAEKTFEDKKIKSGTAAFLRDKVMPRK